MKLKRVIAALSALVIASGALSACGSNETNSNTPTPTPTATSSSEPTPAAITGELSQSFLDENGLEYVPEKDTYRFKETRTISVEVFDRGLDNGKTKPEDNEWAKWIQQGVLDEHNIKVEFHPVDRWDEGNQINNLLAAGSAPDICYSYDYSTVINYGNMDAIVDLAPYFAEENPTNKAIWNWLGDTFINWDKNPDTGVVWAIESKRAEVASGPFRLA